MEFHKLELDPYMTLFRSLITSLNWNAHRGNFFEVQGFSGISYIRQDGTIARTYENRSPKVFRTLIHIQTIFQHNQ